MATPIAWDPENLGVPLQTCTGSRHNIQSGLPIAKQRYRVAEPVLYITGKHFFQVDNDLVMLMILGTCPAWRRHIVDLIYRAHLGLDTGR